MSLFVDYKISQQFGLVLYMSDNMNNISKQMVFPGNLPIDSLLNFAEYLFKKIEELDIHDLLKKEHNIALEPRTKAHKDALAALNELIDIIRYKDQLPAWSDKLAVFCARYGKLANMDVASEKLAAEKKKEELLAMAEKAAKLRVRTTPDPADLPEIEISKEDSMSAMERARDKLRTEVGQAVVATRLRNSALRHIHGNLKPNMEHAKGTDGQAVWVWDGTFTAELINDNRRSYARVTKTTEGKWLVQSLGTRSDNIVRSQEQFDNIEQAVGNALTRF